MRPAPRHRFAYLAAALLLAGAPALHGQAVATLGEVAPAEVGMSAEVLAEISTRMDEVTAAGRTGGVMTLVARHGQIAHWDAAGWRVVDRDELERDDVFRIYSMTKPVTSTAIMMLVESGTVSLDDPVSKFIPAFAATKVYGEGGALRDPATPITIQHLLTHTSGLTYGIFGNSPVDQMYRERLNALSMDTGRTLAETVDVLASLPLIADPGTRWNYSMSTDVLGRVVEVASGMSLADFFEDRIFTPLEMHDTGFHVEPRNHDRLTDVYAVDDDRLVVAEDATTSAFRTPPGWYSGGGGLTSTAMDYLRFSQMLLNEGELEGARILRSETVRLMTRNHLPEGMGTLAPDQGFGLGFAVALGEGAGTYWWSGVANTYFWIDPNEELIAFAWTQFNPFGGAPVDRMIRPIVYRALAGGAGR